jgi:hypothetical protein
VLIAAAAAIVVLFVVLAGGDDDSSDSAGTTQTQSAAGATVTTGPGPGEPQAEETRHPVRRGRGRQAARRRRAPVLQERRPDQFTVTSDVADEVHVHDYDISKDVPAGSGTMRFSFPARTRGTAG